MAFNYYVARIFARRCFADIRINDVPLIRQDVVEDLSADMPINYFIESSGIQNLSLQITPVLGNISFSEGAECSIEIWKYDGSKEKIYPIKPVCASTLKVDKGELGLPLKMDKRMFDAEVSYHINRWDKCKVLNKSRELSAVVITYFQNIGQILEARQYGRFAELIMEREANICNALGVDKRDSDARNKILFECIDNGFIICPIKESKFLEYYANGRIVTLLDKDMKSALRFKNYETGELLVMDILLGIKENQSGLSII